MESKGWGKREITSSVSIGGFMLVKVSKKSFFSNVKIFTNRQSHSIPKSVLLLNLLPLLLCFLPLLLFFTNYGTLLNLTLLECYYTFGFLKVSISTNSYSCDMSTSRMLVLSWWFVS